MTKLNTHNVDLLISAVSKKQYPEHEKPEVAMCGRSNVGKSSFINTILERKNKVVLVDVPGYGYAKLSKSEKEKLYDMIVEYFTTSENLGFVLHLIDSRHKPSQDDIEMNEFLNYYEIPFVVVLTKIDKISKNELSKNTAIIKRELDLTNSMAVIPFSSVTKLGKDKVLKEIEKVLED